MNLNEYVEKHYKGHDIIHGPNWVIIKPTKEELNIANKNALYHSKEKECILCHSKFSFGQTQKIICGECKLIAISEGSGEAFEFLWNCSGTKRKLIIDSIINNEELHLNNGYFDGNMSRHRIGDCPNCGAKNVKIYNSRCTYCANKELNGSINCKKHGFQKHSFAGKCILCLNKQKDYEAQTKLRTKTILENIENGIYNQWPGAVKNSFITKDNIIYYYDKSINDYVIWEEYKSKFKTQNINFQLPDKFQLIPTFRTQDSDTWEGARSAFEQNLVDLDVSWFVYIKFYIDQNGIICPLVVGKNGSLLVNNSGSDLSFSTDINDGPARRFLLELNLE